MAGSHGDLYLEIGSMVVAAHGGEAFDLTEKSEELAHRYSHLGVPADTLARAISRSLGAVGVSMAMVRREAVSASRREPLLMGERPLPNDVSAIEDDTGPGRAASAAIFPSGLRLAVLS